MNINKLNERQIKRLNELKEKGFTSVYRRKRKIYSTWYVDIFSIENLLKENKFPCYWYKGRSDMTEKQAEKNNIPWIE